MKSKLQQARKQIDKVDRAIAELINKRAKLAVEVGKIKGISGKAVYVPSREKEVLKNVTSVKSVLNAEAVEAIYKEIIGACRDLDELQTMVGQFLDFDEL